MKALAIALLVSLSVPCIGQGEKRVKSVNEVDEILEMYAQAFTPYITQMVNEHMLFKEQNRKFWRLPDTLTLANKKQQRSLDSLALYFESTNLSREIRNQYTVDPRTFLNLKLATVLQEVDSAFQKKFRHEGLSPTFFKDAHLKIEEKIK